MVIHEGPRPLILLKPISSHLNLVRELHLLIDFFNLLPPFDVNTALFDHNGHSSKFDDIALSNNISMFDCFLFLTFGRSLLEFSNHIRLTAKNIGSAKILKLLRDKFIRPFNLFCEIELQILVLINDIILLILED